MDNRILSVLLSMLMVSMAAAGCLGGDDDDTTPTDVEGCTDSTATNYNPDATVNNVICLFSLLLKAFSNNDFSLISSFVIIKEGTVLFS